MKLSELSANDLGCIAAGVESIRDMALNRADKSALGAALWCQDVLADIGAEAERRDTEANHEKH